MNSISDGRLPPLPLPNDLRLQPLNRLQEAGVDGPGEDGPPFDDTARDTPDDAKALSEGLARSAARLLAQLEAMNDALGKRDNPGELDDLRDDVRVAALDLEARLRGLSAVDEPIAPDVRNALLDALPGPGLRNLPPLTTDRPPGVTNLPPVAPPPSDRPKPDAEPPLMPRVNNTPPEDEKDPYSDSKLWEDIADLIGDIKDGYLDVYSEAVAKYLAFNKALSDLISKLSGWISTSSDGKEVTLNIGELRKALNDILAEFKPPNKNSVLYPKQDKDSNDIEGGTKEDAEKWARDFGLPESSVQEQPEGSGKWVVVIDTSPIDRMLDSIPKDGDEKKMNPFELDIWRSGFTSQENQVKTMMQQLMQRYTTANSTYDNLVKVLSSTIASTLEVAKGFLR
ncbi:IpaD/SipD/SspD family type III secretion system needle tip protein [Pandoraea pnomenusa]|uniref:IpaD/SipD/SspD family type III secretion system needle tip protein n=1 Tax=Pandoraea pnomenusa TaxID=93220 RepID=UPI00114782B1|nr:IpaD/SipD/SspD family type III secretion system needle tip protein [Pandoraea pnomenusa]QDH57969.1 IpaD/SipD/SspD family type III secretion system needle tip protein [Pandoraea pnomenusa]